MTWSLKGNRTQDPMILTMPNIYIYYIIKVIIYITIITIIVYIYILEMYQDVRKNTCFGFKPASGSC